MAETVKKDVMSLSGHSGKAAAANAYLHALHEVSGVDQLSGRRQFC
jgi:hypothetical protein